MLTVWAQIIVPLFIAVVTLSTKGGKVAEVSKAPTSTVNAAGQVSDACMVAVKQGLTNLKVPFMAVDQVFWGIICA